MSDLLKIDIKEEDKYYLINLKGIVDNNTYHTFIDMCTPLINKNNMIINFKELTYISSTGIGVILKLSSVSKKNDYCVILCHISDPIIQIIKLIKMDKFFIIENNIDDAIKLINTTGKPIKKCKKKKK